MSIEGNYVKVFTPKKVLSIPIQIAGLRVTRAGDTIRIELESIQTTILWDTNVNLCFIYIRLLLIVQYPLLEICYLGSNTILVE